LAILVVTRPYSRNEVSDSSCFSQLAGYEIIMPFERLAVVKGILIVDTGVLVVMGAAGARGVETGTADVDADGESLFTGVALDVHPTDIIAHTRIRIMHPEIRNKLLLFFI